MNRDPNQRVELLIEHLFRSEYGRLVAFLTKYLGLEHLSDVEDIAQDVLLLAQKHWAYHTIPDNPSAWLFVAARNRAKNLFNRKKKWRGIRQEISCSENHTTLPPIELQDIEDSVLRMMFVCTSSQLPFKSSTILILNTLCGFSKKEIARGLFMDEEAVKKRLYRAKKTLREGDFSLALPAKRKLRQQIDRVLSCLYLIYNKGYHSSCGDTVIRKDVCYDAMRLTAHVIRYFPDHHAARALLALMCLHTARFDSRMDEQGAIILITHQDRSLWNHELIKLGLNHMNLSGQGNEVSPYHLEAAIAAEHCLSASFEHTNWKRILSLYRSLKNIKRSPTIDLNIAIVKSRLGQIQDAIDMLNGAGLKTALDRYHFYHATLGVLYSESDQLEKAKKCFSRARHMTNSLREKEVLAIRLKRLVQQLEPN